MQMEGRRRLNPDAPPFYPSGFHHFTPDPSPPSRTDQTHSTTPPSHRTSFVSSTYPLTPVPTGPRISGGRRREAAVRRDGGSSTAGGGGGGRWLWKRRGVYRQIMPLHPNQNSTSVMIRNIPNNYTRELLVELLENHCKHENEKEENTIPSAFDFLYLPIDFKHRLNAGYAFVNFTSSGAAWRFHKSMKGKHWDLFESKKIADVTRAKIQGKEALVRNFERMKLCSPSREYLPVWFDPPRDGGRCMDSSMYTIGNVRIEE